MKVTITTSSACEPKVHKAGCKDLAKVRRQHDYGGEYDLEAESLVEISLDYWCDIIGSDHGLGLDSPEAEAEALDYLATGDLYIAPCVTLPERITK